MKLSKLVFAALLAGSVLAISSCKNDGTTANGTNSPSETGPYDTKGGDYFPLAANQQVSAHFRGVAQTFDINGSLTKFDSIDQNRMATTLSSIVIQGTPAYEIAGYDDNGQLSRDGESFAMRLNGVVYGTGGDGTNKSIVLPADLSAGPWNPDPNGDPRYSAKLVSHMSGFTTYNGNTYSNVIKVTASVKDSSSDFNSDHFHVNVTNVTASFYFAKDVGPIQVDFDHVEFYDYDLTNSIKSGYERTLYSGSVARNK